MMRELLQRGHHAKHQRNQKHGRKHGKGQVPVNKPRGASVNQRGFVGRLRQRAQTCQHENHDEGGVNPDVDDDEGEQRPIRIRAPSEVSQPDPAERNAENADRRIGNEQPDQRADDRGDHQRKDQHQAQKSRERALVIEQERDAHAQNHLHRRGNEGIADGYSD